MLKVEIKNIKLTTNILQIANKIPKYHFIFYLQREIMPSVKENIEKSLKREVNE